MTRLRERENGRASTEVVAAPVAAVERASALPTAYFKDSDAYVVVEVAGDVGGATTPETRCISCGAWLIEEARCSTCGAHQ